MRPLTLGVALSRRSQSSSISVGVILVLRRGVQCGRSRPFDDYAFSYSDAIYHVMARGNGRQNIVRDDIDRDRLRLLLSLRLGLIPWRLP
jgi:hypothetical protein